ncbi:hypothetical protein PYCCODRAFT_824442 [Trametes coccinea BRFM310]|uniref:Uncharacterized protein n=1 Tax=Trametes coccinea (strain BRFM310) TaxID=1353009 RepID=A0A1Y2IEY5_TRAC3|nr:hypothetical protein PYCCODRAFT_824442 [Trametes coccinea BRFM310]
MNATALRHDDRVREDGMETASSTPTCSESCIVARRGWIREYRMVCSRRCDSLEHRRRCYARPLRRSRGQSTVRWHGGHFVEVVSYDLVAALICLRGRETEMFSSLVQTVFSHDYSTMSHTIDAMCSRALAALPYHIRAAASPITIEPRPALDTSVLKVSRITFSACDGSVRTRRPYARRPASLSQSRARSCTE